jgi:Xaa-Pro aminopeptidase
MKFIKPGIYEYEIQAEIEHEFMINKTNGNAFHPIIASGKNATFLHYHSNNAPCKDGDLVLLDFGCEYKNYSSDLSRTIPVNGKFSPRQKEVYRAVLKAYKDIIPLFKEGNSIEGIYKEIIPILEEEMIRLKLFTAAEVKTVKEPGRPLWQFYFPHGLSHHIGLDVHDPGEKHAALTAGMVVSCEPGIYIPKENIGVRIETDLLITHDKPIDMFNDLPVEIEEIEQIMLM